MKTILSVIIWFGFFYSKLFSQVDCESSCPVPFVNWDAVQCEHYENFNPGDPLLTTDWKVFPSGSNPPYYPIPATVQLGPVGQGWTFFADFTCASSSKPVDNLYYFRIPPKDYRFSCSVYLTNGNSGYFSLLNSSLGRVIDFYFTGTKTVSIYNASKTYLGSFSYPEGEWFRLNLFYHAGDGRVEIFRNDYKVFEVKNVATSSAGFPSVANFFTHKLGEAFFLGGVCLVTRNSILVNCTQNIEPVCLNGTNETAADNSCYAGERGYLNSELHACSIANDPCDDCDECFTYKFDCGDPKTIYLTSSYCREIIPQFQSGDGYQSDELEWEFKNSSNAIIQPEYLGGTTYNSVNPVCKLPAPGNYTICFRVYKYNGSGRYKFYECCYVVKVAGACTKPPSLYITSSNPNANSEVNFSTTGSDAETFSWRTDDPQAYLSNVSTTGSTFRCGIPSGKECITVCLAVGNGCGMLSKCLKVCRPSSNCGNKPTPHPPISYTVSQSGELSFQNVPSMDSYNWTLPAGCTFTGGTNANSRVPICKLPDLNCSYIICLQMRIGNCYTYCYCFTVKPQISGPVSLDPEEMSCGNSGQEILVPVRVKNFITMTSLDVTALLNPTTVADFTGAVAGPNINPNAFVYQIISTSKIKVAWAGISSSATSLADNDIFCYLKVKLKGAANTTAIISFEASSAIVKQNRNTVIPDFKTGSVCVNGSFTICGKILTEENKPVKEVSVELIGQNTQTVKTDATGNYCFSNVPAGTFTIKPKKLTFPGNGVEIADIADIQGHILGSFILDSPFKIIAADVDNNKSINSVDIARIIPVYFNKNQAFAAVESWRFIPKSFNFPNANNPFQSTFPEIRTIQISKNETNLDFTGIKMGDVDLDRDPQKFGEPVEISTMNTRTKVQQPILDLKINNTQVMPGRKIKVPVYAKGFKNVTTFGFSLGWNANKLKYASLTDFNPALNMSTSNFNTSNIDKGRIGVSWYVLNLNGTSLNDTDTLFSIEFNAVGQDGDSTLLSFIDNPIATNFSNQTENFKLNISNGVVKIRTVLIGVNSKQLPEHFSLFPNPSSNVIHLDMEGKNLNKASVVIVSSDGKLYSVSLETYKEHGVMDISHLPNGLYNLRIVYQNKNYRIPFNKF